MKRWSKTAIEIVNVSSRGQIVIPQRMRKSLGIKHGAKLVAIEKNGVLMLKNESDVVKKLEKSGNKEESGWLALAEQSLKEIWDNKKDEEAWGRYLNE